MSRIAPPAEKITAVGSIYRALIDELQLVPPEWLQPSSTGGALIPVKGEPMKITSIFPPQVQAALIDAAVRIAMSTDTRDMGILGMAPPPRTIPRRPEDYAGAVELDGFDPEDPDAGQ